MKTTTLHVTGMHCNACKLLLEKSLSKVPAIKKVEAHVSKGIVTLGYEGALHLDELQQIIHECGYEVTTESTLHPRFSRNLQDYKIILISLLFFILLYFILQHTGIAPLFEIKADQPSLGVVLLIGITAGFSSCMAVVGGLVLAISSKWNARQHDQTFSQKMVPHLRFNIGRIVGFGVLGGVLGLFGSVVQLSPFMMAVMMLIVGGVMFLLGVNLTHISPKLSSLSLSLPTGTLFAKKEADLLQSPSREFSSLHPLQGWLKTVGSGVLTFFIPCGFTFAMQLYAINTGSFRKGMAVMALFALGTLPGLIGVGSLTSIFKGKTAQIAYKVIGVLVMLLGLYNISNSYGVVATKFGSDSASSQTSLSFLSSSTKQETIIMTYTTSGLQPETVQLTAGKQYEIVIDVQTTVYGCMSTIYLEGLSDDIQSIRKGNQISFSVRPTKVGTYDFLCAMGIPHGAKVIVKAG